MKSDFKMVSNFFFNVGISKNEIIALIKKAVQNI